MNENTTLMLQQLAAKLGTTTEYLWGILLRQAPIDATINLIQSLLILVYCFFIYKKHKSLSEVKDYNGYKERGYDHYNDNVSILMIIGCVVGIILLFAMFFTVDNVINGYFNPEYWSLNKILNAVK